MRISNCFCLNQENDQFLKWYVELLGPVLLGAKPAEILSFPQSDQRSMEVYQGVIELFRQSRELEFIIMDYEGKCRKVFFYHPKVLFDTLKESRNRKFLEQLGYPESEQLEDYLTHLLDKMAEGGVPDEIGLFLGYPLKDVLGFIGHPALKLTKVDGWRFYGDTRASEQKRNEILRAREAIKALLLEKTPEAIVLLAPCYAS